MKTFRSQFIQTCATRTPEIAITQLQGKLAAEALQGTLTFKDAHMEAWITELIRKGALDVLKVFIAAGWFPNRTQILHLIHHTDLFNFLIQILPLAQLDALMSQLHQVDPAKLTPVIEKFKQSVPHPLKFTCPFLAFHLLETQWHEQVLNSPALFPQIFTTHPSTLALLKDYPKLTVSEEVLETYVRQQMLLGKPVSTKDSIFHAILTSTTSQSNFKIKLTGLLQNLPDASRQLTLGIWELYVLSLSSCNRKFKEEPAPISPLRAEVVLQMAEANHIQREELPLSTLQMLDQRDFPKQRQQWSTNGILFILGMKYPIAYEGLLRLIRNWETEENWFYPLKAHYSAGTPAQQREIRRLLLLHHRFESIAKIYKPTNLSAAELSLISHNNFSTQAATFLQQAAPFAPGKLYNAACRERNDAMACHLIAQHPADLDLTLRFLLSKMPQAYNAAKAKLASADSAKLEQAEKYCPVP
jgi:hypothetical protein